MSNQNIIDLTQILTTSELSILNYINDGLRTSEIAERRSCSKRTIEKHRSNIIRKLNLEKGASLGQWLLQHQSNINLT